MELPISVVIIALNEAHNISACVTAARHVSGDVLVLDSGSTDHTAALAETAGARVVQQEWLGYAQTKNAGNLLAKHDWILSLDADEVLSDELIASLKTLKKSSSEVYSFNRLNNYCGTWIRHSNWYPDYVMRLFDRRRCSWQGDFVHETLNYPKEMKVVRLKGDLLHYTYRTAADHYRKLEKYAQLSARERIKKGRKAAKWKVALLPPLKFLTVYIFHRGFLDGRAGFDIARREAKYIRRRNEWMLELSKTSEGSAL